MPANGNNTVHGGTYTVSTLPPAANHTGDLVYVSNALKASETTGNGTGNYAFSDGTNWCRVDTGAVIAA
jgi:hypothetical protein